MNRPTLGALVLSLALATPLATAADAAPPPRPVSPGQRLLDQARRATPERYAYAAAQGARTGFTPDGKSFYLAWTPPQANPASPPPVIVTIHGHGSWAFDELYLWLPYAKERGLSILALQWWFGGGEAPSDYYLPLEVYRIVAPLLEERGIRPGRTLFHGFSRGSANSYGVVAEDVRSGNRFFGLAVANAGKASLDFPVNMDIERGLFGARPFDGTHWVTVCGAFDTHPDRDGCAGMDEAAAWVARYGGAIDLQIRDPLGDHGAFHRNPANVRAALDVFAARLQDLDRSDAAAGRR